MTLSFVLLRSHEGNARGFALDAEKVKLIEIIKN